MSNWAYKVNIKQYLNQYDEDNDGEGMDILTVAKNVRRELKTLPHWIFENLPEQLVQDTERAIERVPENVDYHQLAFNRVLEQIYDVADDHRVWLGL